MLDVNGIKHLLRYRKGEQDVKRRAERNFEERTDI